MVRGAPGRGNRRLAGQESAGNVFPDNGLREVWPERISRFCPTRTSIRGGYAGLRIPGTMPPMKRLIAPTLVIALCGMAAARDEGPDTGITTKAVERLEAKLGKSEIEVEEVRVTDNGVACIDYHSTSNPGKRAHAVLQGERLLISTNSDANDFGKVWSDHCLGPRGGANPNQ